MYMTGQTPSHLQILAGVALSLGLLGCPGMPFGMTSKLGAGPETKASEAGKDSDTGSDTVSNRIGSLEFQKLSEDTAQKLGLFASGQNQVGLPQTSGTENRSEAVTDGMAQSAAPAAMPAPNTGLSPMVGNAGGGLMGAGSDLAPSGVSGGAPVPGSQLAGGIPDMKVPGPMAIGPSFSPYMYATYFPGPFGLMRLKSVTEATQKGATGTFKEVQEQVVYPVLDAWAKDAALVDTNAMVGDDGRLFASSQAFPGMSGWRFTYSAFGRNEVLIFLVTALETRVLRFRWERAVIDPRSITVDSGEAIAKVVAAIRDKAFKAKEELLGRDYFFETDGPYPRPPGGGPMPMPGGGPMPMPMPMPGGGGMPAEARPMPAPMLMPMLDSATGSGSTPAPRPTPPPFIWTTTYSNEILYDLKVGGRWNIGLAPVTKYVVWNLNYSVPYDYSKPEMPLGVVRDPSGGFKYEPVEGQKQIHENHYFSAMVDARTGDVIRLSRPSRTIVTMVKMPTPQYPAGYPYDKCCYGGPMPPMAIPTSLPAK
jgi:hypothetical protein